MSVTQIVFFLFLSAFCKSSLQQQQQQQREENNGTTLTLPDPHIVILGPTGVGKSSLAKVLIGESPDCDNCTFEICSGTDSCTRETTYAIGNYVGYGPLFTVVDTPGFGDSDNDDNVLIDEMITVLKDVVKTANSLVILFNGESERFDANVQQMLREMEALFGKETFWTHAILGVSHWGYSQNDQIERNVTGKTEDWWAWEMNRQLQEKFHVEFNLSAVFIDSWAKMPHNIGDPLQQVAFDRETQMLWELTSALDIFEFKTIEDVLNELTVCRNTLENNITEIWRAIESSEEDIAKNTVDILDLNMDQGVITDELTYLTAEVATLTQYQEEINYQVMSDIASHQEALDIHSADIERNVAAIEELNRVILTYLENSSPPLGTILPWTSRPAKDTTNFISVIPDGWQLCDGSPIVRGPWLGQTTPNLNGNELFLRGSSDGAKVLDTEDESFQDHTHIDNGHAHAMNPHRHDFENRILTNPLGEGRKFRSGNHLTYENNFITTKDTTSTMQSANSGIGLVTSSYKRGAETRPKNMRVQYIIRIE